MNKSAPHRRSRRFGEEKLLISCSKLKDDSSPVQHVASQYIGYGSQSQLVQRLMSEAIPPHFLVFIECAEQFPIYYCVNNMIMTHWTKPLIVN